MERTQAVEFIIRLEQLYLEQRDMKALLAAMAPEVTWIGSGRGEVCCGKQEARRLLEQDLAEYGGAFSITERWQEAEPLPGEGWLIYGGFRAEPGDPSAGRAELDLRFSAVCTETEDGLQLCHIHLSQPDFDQRPGRLYVLRDSRARTEEFRQRAAESQRELLDVMENLPGGVLRCRDDRGFTILQMSSGFLDMVGYRPAELEEQYHNRLIELIHPDDRENVRKNFRAPVINSTVEQEYRLICRDGHPLWVLDRSRLVRSPGGAPVFNTMLMDITERKQAQEALRLSLERHQIIMDQTNDIIFEWNIVQDTLSFSNNWQKKFGYAPIRREISTRIPGSKDVHPDDMSAFRQLLKAASAGAPYSSAEFRIRSWDGRYLWCRIRATTQFDSEGRPIKAVGVITDIDAEKKHEQRLLEQAQKDSLTGLLNQSAARSRAAELIEGRRPEEIQALMILDLDNFKNVNDQYGHLCGDAVLTDLAACLKRQFRGSDVIGRIGGDEFAVFLSSLSQASDAGVKAGEILAAIAALPLEGAPDLQLSCSVGIALCPADGADYQRLYQCADLALYQAKSQGKACFAYYSQELEDGPGRSGRSRSAVSSPIDSDSVCDVTEQLARYAFRMLYDAGTAEAAIGQMLEVVGRAYDVSRVYIFENSADDTLCYNTFEWCGEGVSSERENLQGLSYQEDLGDYQSNFDANGIFYCRDISTLHPHLYAVLAPQGICSMLQCAILDDGRFKGYVGFDECRANRYWTQEQIESLTLVARVLSTFLVKQRLREHVQALEQRLAQEKEQ